MKMMICCVTTFLLLIFAFPVSPTLAATIHVPAEQPTIQAGIDAASNGDLVLVAPGTYVENIDFLGKAITVQGEGGLDVTNIDGGQAGSVVLFDSGETEDTLLDGFTVRNGEALKGGGIYCDNSSPTITNCTISENGSMGVNGGGGIYSYSSSPMVTNCTISGNMANIGGGIWCVSKSSTTITNCTITGNSADSSGGGICCSNFSTSTITSCIISENSAQKGGGIQGYRYSGTITDCVITGNIADDWGGGIYFYEETTPTVTSCTISGNRATLGGGIYCEGYWHKESAPTIESCIITNNTAQRGAGVHCSLHTTPTISNCTISRNSAEDLGGGICSYGGAPWITNCTLMENNAGSMGGGIACGNSDPTIINCIFWGDAAPEGPEIAVDSIYALLIVSYSNIQGGEAEAYIEPGCFLGWEEGNIDSDPLFIGEDDYHISNRSPCIDAGTDAGVYADFDGEPRPHGAGFDMGADENVDCWDYDGDHWPDDSCGGDDCDDSAPLTYPGAPEVCDGLDNSCDGVLPEDERDEDEDGWMICSGDCDDADQEINPGAREGPEGDPTCSDGIDNDCSGLIDMEDPHCYCQDIDEDGYFDEACGGDDCDDTDSAVHPDAPEVCDNGIDDDCDGQIDSEQLNCIHVPDEQPTIQDGINAAEDGDTVIVALGTYVENIDFMGKAITIQSEAGSDGTIIDGDQAGSVVLFTNNETEEAVLSGFTIRNGYVHFPGVGAGICCLDSSPTITNCTVTENSTEVFGGGIYCWGYNASPTIESCVITRNTGRDWASSGGGIYVDSSYSTTTIVDCTISENTAGSSGGIECRGTSSTVTIADCTIAGNTALHGGGGIYCLCSSTITNCTISENSAFFGGGIDCGASPTIANCTIASNKADYQGGGIYCVASPTITNCTIVDNTSDYQGGGICSEGGAPWITNSILWGDSAPEGPEIAFLSESTLTISYSDVRGGESAAYIEPGCIIYWLEGNIDVDPVFVGAANYHLTPVSPCIDAGTDAGIYTDMDGDARPQGFGFDIGADEVVPPGPCKARIVPISRTPIILYLFLAISLICISIGWRL